MTLIQRLDGTTYNLLDYGIRTRDLIIPSPNPEHNFGKVEGGIGVIDYGTTYGPRNITGYYRATSYDIIGFSLMRDEIFDVLRTEESFYLIEKRLQGKRWLVKVANPYQIPQKSIFGNFEIDFIGIKGVSESIGTTQDIQTNGINAEDGLWGFGMGLIADDESLIYTHTGNSFKIYNAGNVPIHPFEQELKITIDQIQGSTSFLQLSNLTTGDSFRVNNGGSGTITLDGPNITRGPIPYLRNTNMEFITLAPGWNQFLLTGASSARVAFDFPFYYL